MTAFLSEVIGADGLRKPETYAGAAGEAAVQVLGWVVDRAFIDARHADVACFEDAWIGATRRLGGRIGATPRPPHAP